MPVGVCASSGIATSAWRAGDAAIALWLHLSIVALTFKAVGPDRWNDLAQLFEAPGGPKSCWCMLWRSQGPRARGRDGAARRDALRERVEDGQPVGILGYLEGEPVAWCSVAPRETYRALGGPKDPETGLWSLVCFYVPRRLRGRGIGRQLLDAAIVQAREMGASILEAYPVDQDSPSYRFMGFVPLFQDRGFEAVGRAGTRRHVMRLPL